MTNAAKFWIILGWMAALAGCFALPRANAGTVEIAVHHLARGAELQLGSLRYDTLAGERFSFTRASYLLSGFGFQRMDGSWLDLTNSAAWFDAETGRTSAQFDVASGQYSALRFSVGLEPALNHAAPASFAPEHPLNPNLNNLHWSWQGGYVFMAMEGIWRNAGAFDGWSYHLARDTNRLLVRLPLQLPVEKSARVELDFDLWQVIEGAHALSFARDGSSTHSREGDPVIAAVLGNLSGAFHVRGIAGPPHSQVEALLAKPLYLPEKFTPFRFATSPTFPLPHLPRDNPLLEERVALGQRLFGEPLLSRDGSVSCATCHDPQKSFSDSRRVSTGVDHRSGQRQSMPLLNLAWKSSFFWDGRAPSLREQALLPIQDHAEMDESLTNLITKLQRAGFGPGFARAFGSDEITGQKVGLALEQYLLTLTSFDSKFDRAQRHEAELSAAEKRGLELFMTEYDPRRGQYGADCFHCHGGALFRSQSFANNGLDESSADPGRSAVTGQSTDLGKFATPSLRNVELTAPYMHDGRFLTLEQVVAHYSQGVRRSATLDPNLAKHPTGGLHLTASDQSALVAFLKTLTDPKFTQPERPTEFIATLRSLK